MYRPQQIVARCSKPCLYDWMLRKMEVRKDIIFQITFNYFLWAYERGFQEGSETEYRAVIQLGWGDSPISTKFSLLVASQGGRIESTGKPWGMRGFRLHPQTQTGWALLPMTQASSEPVTLTRTRHGDMEMQILCSQFWPEKVMYTCFEYIWWYFLCKIPSLSHLCSLEPSSLIFRWEPPCVDHCRVNSWPRCTV